MKLQKRTVTVFVALTHPKKQVFALIAPFGTPRFTTSFSAAPVTVMVRSDEVPATVLGKSSVAVAERTFRIAVPLLPIVTPPVSVLAPVTVRVVPIFTALATPIPPAVKNAPVPVVVESVVEYPCNEFVDNNHFCTSLDMK